MDRAGSWRWLGAITSDHPLKHPSGRSLEKTGHPYICKQLFSLQVTYESHCKREDRLSAAVQDPGVADGPDPSPGWIKSPLLWLFLALSQQPSACGQGAQAAPLSQGRRAAGAGASWVEAEPAPHPPFTASVGCPAPATRPRWQRCPAPGARGWTADLVSGSSVASP